MTDKRDDDRNDNNDDNVSNGDDDDYCNLIVLVPVDVDEDR